MTATTNSLLSEITVLLRGEAAPISAWTEQWNGRRLSGYREANVMLPLQAFPLCCLAVQNKEAPPFLLDAREPRLTRDAAEVAHTV